MAVQGGWGSPPPPFSEPPRRGVPGRDLGGGTAARAPHVPMIKVSRLNGREFVVNAELIQFLEATPDTVITLTNHEKIVVREAVDEIVKRIVDYNRSIRGPVLT